MRLRTLSSQPNQLCCVFVVLLLMISGVAVFMVITTIPQDQEPTENVYQPPEYHDEQGAAYLDVYFWNIDEHSGFEGIEFTIISLSSSIEDGSIIHEGISDINGKDSVRQKIFGEETESYWIEFNIDGKLFSETFTVSPSNFNPEYEDTIRLYIDINPISNAVTVNVPES